MKKEIKVIYYSMINNLIISIIKIIGGFLFSMSSLFADGLHTFSDFITDIVCLVGSKLSKKRPTKYHPFGFGKIEYLTNLFIGFILMILGFFIIINSFNHEAIIPPLTILFLLIIVLSLKLIAILIMHKVGNKIHSQLLITSVKESKADLYSTIGVIIITILLQFSNKMNLLKYSDLIGSLIIGLIVLKTSLKIIIENSLCLIGEVENDEETIKKIKKLIEENRKIKVEEVDLIKYGTYYKLQLTIKLDANLTLKQVSRIERKLIKKIKCHRSLKIKYVNIYVIDNK